MNRREAIETIKKAIAQVEWDYPMEIAAAFDLAVADMKSCEANNAGWISVKDRLPERKWIDCLVATKIQTDGTRGFNIAWVNDDNGVWKSNDEWICDGREIVTHWRPLTDLPKEEEHETD